MMPLGHSGGGGRRPKPKHVPSTGTTRVITSFRVEKVGGGSIAAQTTDVAFAIKVTALDQFGDVLTGYTGTVDITSTGTLSAGSGTTAAFTAGVLASHSVTISAAASGKTITATKTGSTESGTSNSFDIAAPPSASWEIVKEYTLDSETPPSGWGVYPDGNGDPITIVTDSPAGVSGARMRHTYLSALPSGSSPGNVEAGISSEPEVRIQQSNFLISASPAYEFENAGLNKNIHVWINGSNRVIFVIRGSGSGTAVLGVALQGIVSFGGNRNYTTNVELVRGTEYDFEFFVRGNDASTANGSFSMTIDGAPVQFQVSGVDNDCDDIQFTSAAAFIDTGQWNTTFGGFTPGSTVGAQATPNFYAQCGYLSIARRV